MNSTEMWGKAPSKRQSIPCCTMWGKPIYWWEPQISIVMVNLIAWESTWKISGWSPILESLWISWENPHLRTFQATGLGGFHLITLRRHPRNTFVHFQGERKNKFPFAFWWFSTSPHEFQFRSYLDRHCLGILFSNKAFPKRVLGLAWRGDPSKHSGICQKRQAGSGANLNSLFITLRTSNMERIPLQMGILNLLHEILHAFGARHDPKGTTPSYYYLFLRSQKFLISFRQSKT